MARRIATGVLVIVAAGGCSGSNVVVTGSSEGAQIDVVGNHPPVQANVSDKGVEGPPTPTPGPLDPIIPITPPPPTPTPGP